MIMAYEKKFLMWESIGSEARNRRNVSVIGKDGMLLVEKDEDLFNYAVLVVWDVEFWNYSAVTFVDKVWQEVSHLYVLLLNKGSLYK